MGEGEMGEEDYSDNRYQMKGQGMGQSEYDDELEDDGEESMMQS
jgi:hypothetical protein